MSLSEFNNFHNQVLNLPRDSFSNFTLMKVKSIAEYLYLIKDEFPPEGLKVKDIYIKIHYKLQNESVDNPHDDFEKLFDLSLKSKIDIENHYKDPGRGFRHWPQLASLLEILFNVTQGNRWSKRILDPFIEELVSADNQLIKSLVRNKILSVNVRTNPCCGNLDSYDFYRDLDFRPAYAILKYLFEIKRPATKFELSIFFGRPDYNIGNEEEIISEAIKNGRKFPISQDEQIDYYFKLKKWIYDNGNIFEYRTSQQPYFKFNSMFIIMESVGLIKVGDSFVNLTDYSLNLFGSEVKPEVIEIESLLDEIEIAGSNTELTETVIRNRSNLISDLIENDEKFLDKINKRASSKSGKSTVVSQTTKLIRDELIREASKIIANYTCRACGKETFLDKNDNNFVESHHIIGYNDTEDGPDVLQNLIVLCPNCHAKLHFAKVDIIKNFYEYLRKNNVITLDQFIFIASELNILKEKHIRVLLEKKIIQQNEADRLYEIII